MNARFLHPSARKDNATAQRGPGDTVGLPAEPVAPADRACCCPAKAVVRVTMPSTLGRPGETDLLLCAHHYRVSSRALTAASATVRELPGTPHDIATWIELGPLAASTEG
jgi:hypothetical protein